jgi:effector-binding domain-containing protein
MQQKAVVPLAPPLAVYRGWDGRSVTVDVGFPVGAADAAKATGEIRAGQTPNGAAIKAVHRGPYAGLKDTYALLDKAMKAEGFEAGEVSWEIYYGEPGKTPDEDLITEIYMQLKRSEAQAAG